VEWKAVIIGQGPFRMHLMIYVIQLGDTKITLNNHKEYIEKEHGEAMEKVLGNVSTVKCKVIVIQRYVLNQKLWRKMKFITSGKESELKTNMSFTILSDLCVGRNDETTFWLQNWKRIYKCWGTKCNNVITSLKKISWVSEVAGLFINAITLSNCVYFFSFAQHGHDQKDGAWRFSCIVGAWHFKGCVTKWTKDFD
jgi:hypothetical protein